MANQAKHGETVFNVGDRVKVHQKIVEGKKERLQIFEGIVIAIRGRGENKSFTVRRIAVGNIGVERIWPLVSPWVQKIEVIRRGKVRRAKLYYLRKQVGKKAVRIKTKEEPRKKPEKTIKKRGTANEKKKPRQPRGKPGPKKAEK
jgi:large subunit ribosomal protein L19